MYEKIELSNGVRIVFDKMDSVRTVALGIWVLSGSRSEDEDINGISHFIEHMMFKGTDNRSAKDIADEVDFIGGQLDAATSKESTYFYTRVLDTHFDRALDILSDMFFNSKFADAEIDKERNVILEEINMYEDSPESLVFDILQSEVWKGDSLGNPILGTEKTIMGFNYDKLKDYFTKNYCPQNTVISVAGNFDAGITVKKIEKYFGSFNHNGVYEPKILNPAYNKSFITREKDIEQINLVMAFPSIPRGSDESYALNILDLLFGGGMSSILFQSVREERGMCYSIYSHNSGFVDRGLFSVYTGLNISQVKDAVRLIKEEIVALKSGSVTEDQLYRAKEQLKSNYIMSLESTTNRMSRIGTSELLLRRILTPDQLIAKIDGVTIKDFNSLASKIFDFNNLSISAVGKTKGLESIL